MFARTRMHASKKDKKGGKMKWRDRPTANQIR